MYVQEQREICHRSANGASKVKYMTECLLMRIFNILNALRVPVNDKIIFSGGAGSSSSIALATALAVESHGAGPGCGAGLGGLGLGGGSRHSRRGLCLLSRLGDLVGNSLGRALGPSRRRGAKLSGAGAAGHAGPDIVGGLGAGDRQALKVTRDRGIDVLEFVGGLVQDVDLAGASEGALALGLGCDMRRGDKPALLVEHELVD